jgi:hypothetical protein
MKAFHSAIRGPFESKEQALEDAIQGPASEKKEALRKTAQCPELVALDGVGAQGARS